LIIFATLEKYSSEWFWPISTSIRYAALVVAYDLGGYGQAAERLGRTPSAVSSANEAAAAGRRRGPVS
jgi:hypothetical protein